MAVAWLHRDTDLSGLLFSRSVGVIPFIWPRWERNELMRSLAQGGKEG